MQETNELEAPSVCPRPVTLATRAQPPQALSIGTQRVTPEQFNAPLSSEGVDPTSGPLDECVATGGLSIAAADEPAAAGTAEQASSLQPASAQLTLLMNLLAANPQTVSSLIQGLAPQAATLQMAGTSHSLIGHLPAANVGNTGEVHAVSGVGEIANHLPGAMVNVTDPVVGVQGHVGQHTADPTANRAEHVPVQARVAEGTTYAHVVPHTMQPVGLQGVALAVGSTERPMNPAQRRLASRKLQDTTRSNRQQTVRKVAQARLTVPDRQRPGADSQSNVRLLQRSCNVMPPEAQGAKPTMTVHAGN